MATKRTKAKIVGGLVTVGIAGGAFVIWDSMDNVNPTYQEIQALTAMRNAYIEDQGGSVVIPKGEDIFDHLDDKLVGTGLSTTTYRDFVKVEGEEKYKYRDVEYSPAEFKNRAKDLVEKINPDAL